MTRHISLPLALGVTLRVIGCGGLLGSSLQGAEYFGNDGIKSFVGITHATACMPVGDATLKLFFTTGVPLFGAGVLELTNYGADSAPLVSGEMGLGLIHRQTERRNSGRMKPLVLRERGNAGHSGFEGINGGSTSFDLTDPNRGPSSEHGAKKGERKLRKQGIGAHLLFWIKVFVFLVSFPLAYSLFDKLLAIWDARRIRTLYSPNVKDEPRRSMARLVRQHEA